MADIFVSYAHEDAEFTRRMVRALEAEGFSVWWDHTIPPGKTWEDIIAQGIADAKCCVVIWSTHSIRSDWVKEEASIAKKEQKFIPVQIDECEPPVGFRRVHAARLVGWTGNRDDPQWRLLVSEAHNAVDAVRSGAAPAASQHHGGHQNHATPAAHSRSANPVLIGITGAALALAAVAVGFVMLRPQAVSPPAPVEAIAALSPSLDLAIEAARPEEREAAEQRLEEERQRMLREQRQAEQAARNIAGAWRFRTDYYNCGGQQCYVEGAMQIVGSGGNYTCSFEFTQIASSGRTGARETCRIIEQGGGTYRFVSTVVEATASWNADNFTLTREGRDRMVGTTDDGNMTVRVVFTR